MKIDRVKWSKELVEKLGGAENIISATHCLTRLRLVLKDESLINIKEIESFESVKGTFKQGGQFQIVIGPDVSKYFRAFIDVTGIREVSSSENKAIAAKQSGKWWMVFLNFMAEVFIPIVPVLVAGGIILGIRNIFEADFDGWVMVKESQFIAGLNDFLWIPAQACFWWLPVHICWSIFRYKNADQIIGIVLGLTLLLPPLLNVYEVTGGEEELIWIWDIMDKIGPNGSFDFGFMNYPWKIAYTAQVVPAMIIGIIGAYTNLWIRRVSPGWIAQMSVPLVTILPIYTLAMFAIGPAGFILGSVIGIAFKWAFTNSIAKYFFAIIFGFLHGPLVITGLHHLLNAVMAQEVTSNQGTIIFLSICMQSIAQGGAVIGWIIINNKNPRVKDIAAPSIVSAYLGVTEPAMYGITIKAVYPLLGACIGAAAGLEFLIISGVSAAGIGNGSWLGILSIQVQSKIPGVNTWPGTGYLWFIVGALISTATSILATMGLSKIKFFKKFDEEHTESQLEIVQ